MKSNSWKIAHVALCIVVFAGCVAAGETVKIEGIIAGRSGDEIIAQFANDADLAFQLTDTTEVSQICGLLNARGFSGACRWLAKHPHYTH